MQGKKQFTEKLFTNFQLSDRVPEDNFYRRLKSVVELPWLYKATKKYYGSEGQQSIDPIVFFKLMLIGYLENLGSDRRIINTVCLRLDMLFFSRTGTGHIGKLSGNAKSEYKRNKTSSQVHTDVSDCV